MRSGEHLLWDAHLARVGALTRDWPYLPEPQVHQQGWIGFVRTTMP